MKEELKDFIRKFNTVPPSHHVLARLRQAIADENSDLGDIASIIKVDSSLATSVMRLSNSAYFGTPTQTDSIEEAISLLGSREIYKLAAIVAILDMMNSRKSAYPLSSEEIWRTTVLTAIIMERFARIASLDGHAAYTIGLVHSVGKWILNQFMEVYSGEIDFGVDKDYASLARWERNTFDTDHAEVGGEVLTKWDFTNDLSQPVLYQLNPLQSPSSEHIPMACLLRSSISAAAYVTVPRSENGNGNGNGNLSLKVPPEVMENVGLSDFDMEEVLPLARQELVQVYKLLRTI